MQGRFTVPLPSTTPRLCVVCAEPIEARIPLTPRKGGAASAPELYPLCLEASCRWLFNELQGLPDAEFGRHLQWRGQGWREERIRIRRLRKRRQAEADEADAAFAALGRDGLPAPPDLQLVVPSGHRPSRPLSQRRRRAHAAHLDAIIAAAQGPATALPAPSDMAEPSAPDSDTIAPDSRLPGRLCGFCGGGCCVSGGDRAYLSEATIRRVLAEDPSLDPAGLRALYLGHLTARTISRSCIHHTRDGCTLPRALRSDICNRWACKPLAALLTGLMADPPVRTAVVLRRRQNQWNQDKPALDNEVVRAAVLTETETRLLAAPKPEAGSVGRPQVTGER